MAQKRAAVPGMPGAGVLLGAPEQIRYPLIVETILHAAGINVVPMGNGAVMLRFPSTNGFTVSVPLSPSGVDELLAQLAQASEPVDPSATVSE